MRLKIQPLRWSHERANWHQPHRRRATHRLASSPRSPSHGLPSRRGALGNLPRGAVGSLKPHRRTQRCVGRAVQAAPRSSSSCPVGGGRGGARASRPGAPRTRAMSSGSVTTSSRRIRPAHSGHRAMSTANTRRKSHAQGCRVGGGGTSGPPSSGDKSGSCSSATGSRPGTTSARALAFPANTP